jgi:hypothetical protein
MTCFWNNLHRVQSKSKYLNIVFGSKNKKTKGPKHDSQNQLWSLMTEGGEPQF